jgi:hypothetical protein
MTVIVPAPTTPTAAALYSIKSKIVIEEHLPSILSNFSARD